MNYSISKIIPYVRRYVLLGIYDVLDGERVPYQKKEDTVVAKAEVYGNLSTFSISAEEQEMGTELKVTMLQSCVGLSEQGKERAMTAVMDRIVQYLENERRINMDKKRAGVIKLLILAVVLVAAIITGFLTGAIQPDALASSWAFSADVLLRLVIMMAGVLFVEYLVELILGYCKPEAHRARSVITIIRSLLKYAAAIVILCWGLTIIGVNITVVLASVGVLTLIVGFSAESLIADLVTGLFMLFENQYNVGDIVEIGGFRGTVTDIGIRTTSITDASENIKVINNADMRNILNRSDRVSKSICDIPIPYKTDLEDLEAALPGLLDEIYKAHSDAMKAGPVYLGVQSLADSAVILRFCVDVREKDIYSAIRILNRELLLGFRRLGVECPFPQLDVHSR